MDNAMQTAKALLVDNGYTCVLYADGQIYSSVKRGVKPLLEFLESGERFRGFVAADKTVGAGAAHLYVLLGVRAVWANVLSEAGRQVLQRQNIPVYYETVVPFIINRAGDGMCPIEAAVKEISDACQALTVIKDTLRALNT